MAKTNDGEQVLEQILDGIDESLTKTNDLLRTLKKGLFVERMLRPNHPGTAAHALESCMTNVSNALADVQDLYTGLLPNVDVDNPEDPKLHPTRGKRI